MRSELGKKRGQTMVMFTLGSTLLFGSLGLVVDVGWAFFRREAAQTAADSAASAAAAAAYLSAGGGSINCSVTNVACYSTEYECPSTLTTATNNIQAGCLYAQRQWVHNGRPAESNLHVRRGNRRDRNGHPHELLGDRARFRTDPQLFSAVLGFSKRHGDRASHCWRQNDGRRGCVIELNPTSSGAISMNGNTSLTTGCGVYTNSNSSSAINIVGGGTDHDYRRGQDEHRGQLVGQREHQSFSGDGRGVDFRSAGRPEPAKRRRLHGHGSPRQSWGRTRHGRSVPECTAAVST